MYKYHALKWIPRAYGAEVGDHAHSGYLIEMSLTICESADSMCLGLSDEFLVPERSPYEQISKELMCSRDRF